MFISCQLLPLLQMFISLQLLPSFQCFTLFRLLNNNKKCVGQVLVILAPIWLLPFTPPTYQPADNKLADAISQLAFTICQLADANQDVSEVTEDAIEVTSMSASWPSTTVSKLTKGIGELTCHRSDRVPEVITCFAI